MPQKKDFETEIEKYFVLEKCFLPNDTHDYDDVKKDLNQLRQIDFIKLHQRTTF